MSSGGRDRRRQCALASVRAFDTLKAPKVFGRRRSLVRIAAGKNTDKGNTPRDALFPFLFPLPGATLSARRSADRCPDEVRDLR